MVIDYCKIVILLQSCMPQLRCKLAMIMKLCSQKEIPTPKTEMGNKTKLTIRQLDIYTNRNNQEFAKGRKEW